VHHPLSVHFAGRILYPALFPLVLTKCLQRLRLFQVLWATFGRDIIKAGVFKFLWSVFVIMVSVAIEPE
jgi:hypothetical protein